MNLAGNVRDIAARAIETVPSSRGYPYLYPTESVFTARVRSLEDPGMRMQQGSHRELNVGPTMVIHANRMRTDCGTLESMKVLRPDGP